MSWTRKTTDMRQQTTRKNECNCSPTISKRVGDAGREGVHEQGTQLMEG